MTIDCITQHTHPAATALGAKPSTDAEWSEFLGQQRAAAYNETPRSHEPLGDLPPRTSDLPPRTSEPVDWSAVCETIEKEAAEKYRPENILILPAEVTLGERCLLRTGRPVRVPARPELLDGCYRRYLVWAEMQFKHNDVDADIWRLPAPPPPEPRNLRDPALHRISRLVDGVVVECIEGHQDNLRWKWNEWTSKVRYNPDVEVAPQTPVSLPDFPTHLLPASARALVDAERTRLGMPAGMLALPVLVTLAAAIGGRRSVRTDDRTHPSTLFGAIVAPPGSAKSPALDVALAPLRLAAEERDHERVRAWRQFEEWQADRTKDKGDRPHIPPPMRTTDVTTEALAGLLATAPLGIIADPDELSAWANTLDAYRDGKRGPDRARYCSMWSGHGIAIERKGKAPIVASTPVVSIVGGIQPAVLPALNSAADGLAQRFLYSFHADHDAGYPTRIRPDRAVLAGWQATVDRLLLLTPNYAPSGSSPKPLAMTEAALDAWFAGRDRCVDARRLNGSPEVYLKFDSLSARIALALTLGADPSAAFVDTEAVHAAWTLLLDYFAPHAIAALAGSAPAADEHPLLRLIRDRGGKVKRRDVLRAQRSGLKTEVELDAALAMLGSQVTTATERPTGGGPASVCYAA